MLLRVIGVRLIADQTDGGENVTEAQDIVIPDHPSPMRGVVDLHGEHTVEIAQVAFVEPNARSTGDAFEQQRRLTHCAFAGGDKTFLNFRVVVDQQFMQKVRHQFVGSLREAGAVTVISLLPRSDNGFGNGLATRAAHLPGLAKDLGL